MAEAVPVLLGGDEAREEIVAGLFAAPFDELADEGHDRGEGRVGPVAELGGDVGPERVTGPATHRRADLHGLVEVDPEELGDGEERDPAERLGGVELAGLGVALEGLAGVVAGQRAHGVRRLRRQGPVDE